MNNTARNRLLAALDTPGVAIVVLPPGTFADGDEGLDRDDLLDITYPGLCHDCAEKLSNLLKTLTALQDLEEFGVLTQSLWCSHELVLRYPDRVPRPPSGEATR